ncbi:hypothetical protein G7K_6581-t2 [Saitoella complicata NRRL Y-17804]|uniref:Dolichol-phosphate mannosyltransferase subunit 3 n=1 Tax=Saitoella complicata (strain BCRC 22490 / CBS 7301 / JCM 7358 / NBRC 10748 / NRRL Y-17804) TaxID=698492 RepID=A0A0E9NRL6_SAICN|nr:hypothetical protein G7K_6581-t2 [Saitoella complicata NRRL Y-17804]
MNATAAPYTGLAVTANNIERTFKRHSPHQFAMTRAERLLRNFFVAAVLYIGVFLGYIPAPKSLEEIWLYVPFLVVVSFGLVCYTSPAWVGGREMDAWATQLPWCLYTLVYGVLTFQDKEADFKELVKEIETAKADLRTKGVTVD